MAEIPKIRLIKGVSTHYILLICEICREPERGIIVALLLTSVSSSTSTFIGLARCDKTASNVRRNREQY